jgi:hypothetical protein
VDWLAFFAPRLLHDCGFFGVLEYLEAFVLVHFTSYLVYFQHMPMSIHLIGWNSILSMRSILIVASNYLVDAGMPNIINAA